MSTSRTIIRILKGSTFLNIFCQSIFSGFLINTTYEFALGKADEPENTFHPYFIPFIFLAGFGAFITGLSSIHHFSLSDNKPAKKPTAAAETATDIEKERQPQTNGLSSEPIVPVLTDDRCSFFWSACCTPKTKAIAKAAGMGAIFSTLNLFGVQDALDDMGLRNDIWKVAFSWILAFIFAVFGEGIYAMTTHYFHHEEDLRPAPLYKEMWEKSPCKAFGVTFLFLCMLVSETSESVLTVDLIHKKIKAPDWFIYLLGTVFGSGLCSIQLYTAYRACLTFFMGVGAEFGKLAPEKGKPAYAATFLGSLNDVFGGAAGFLKVLCILTSNAILLESLQVRIGLIILAYLISLPAGFAQTLTDVGATQGFLNGMKDRFKFFRRPSVPSVDKFPLPGNEYDENGQLVTFKYAKYLPAPSPENEVDKFPLPGNEYDENGQLVTFKYAKYLPAPSPENETDKSPLFIL